MPKPKNLGDDTFARRSEFREGGLHRGLWRFSPTGPLAQLLFLWMCLFVFQVCKHAICLIFCDFVLFFDVTCLILIDHTLVEFIMLRVFFRMLFFCIWWCLMVSAWFEALQWKKRVPPALG